MTATELVFDPFSEEFFNGPWEIYRRLREEAPVYYNAEHDFYALSRHADVAAAFKDHETFSSAYGLDLAMVKSGEPVPMKMIILMDPPEHRKMRSLVNKVFTPRQIANLKPMVVGTIDRCFTAADPQRFDVVQEFAAFFPVEVITQMLGVPAERRQQVRQWVDTSLHREPGQIEMSAEGQQAIAEGIGVRVDEAYNPTDHLADTPNSRSPTPGRVEFERGNVWGNNICRLISLRYFLTKIAKNRRLKGTRLNPRMKIS